jgi:predicted nucleotidyltransferase
MPTRTLPAEDLRTFLDRVLEDLVASVREGARNHVKSIVLYGSAAEGRLRPTSDVNLLIVLSAFEPSELNLLREPYRVAQAAFRVRCMFLLEREIADASHAFAEKFADILRRRRVLFGPDVFASLEIPRAVVAGRLRQVLLNDVLRLREAYVSTSLREEQLVRVIAEFGGPLRSAAATLLSLEGDRPMAGKEALAAIVSSFPDAARWAGLLEHISEAREQRAMSPSAPSPTVLGLIELAQRLCDRAAAIAQETGHSDRS